MKAWINNSSREILKSHVLQCTAKPNRVENFVYHSTACSRSHEKGYHFSKAQCYRNGNKCMLGRTQWGRQETTLFPVLFHYEYFKTLLLYFKKNLGFKNLRLEVNEKIDCMLHCYKIKLNFLQKKFSKHLLHNHGNWWWHLAMLS